MNTTISPNPSIPRNSDSRKWKTYSPNPVKAWANSSFIYKPLTLLLLYWALFILGCAAPSLLRWLFSGCGAQASHCVASRGAWAVGWEGFSSCSSGALQHRLNSCGSGAYLLCSMWALLGSGIEPASPALTGRFFITEPPGKPLIP